MGEFARGIYEAGFLRCLKHVAVCAVQSPVFVMQKPA